MAVRGVSVALLRPMAELLGRLDVDSERFLALLGIDREATPETYVAGDRVDRLLDELAEARGDATFGLTLAEIAVVRPLGLFGHVVWLSGTVRDAITRAVRFYGMVTRRTTLTLDEHAGVATLRQQPVANVTRGTILTEFVFASFALRARAATENRFALRAVRFAHARRRSELAAYARVFAAPVVFDCTADEIEFDAAMLDLRLASADPITAAALEPNVAILAAAASGRSPLVDRVRRVIGAELAAPVSLATIATRLGLSARTLRRRLEHEGTCIRAVLDELRRERADELLVTGVSVKEIAFALGFSETSAFSRAYKRWTGKPPMSA